ncbi:TPA: PerC family transcriptional regulator [Klebsiella quasipneumoniae]
MIRDKKAEELEAKGLFRRAAARWLDVMAACTEDADREQAKRNRERCLEVVKRPRFKLEEFADLHRAAKATTNRMGIAQNNGEAFRLPASRKRARKARNDGA